MPETTLENPVIKEIDAEKAELRRLVEQEDAKPYPEAETPDATTNSAERATEMTDGGDKEQVSTNAEASSEPVKTEGAATEPTRDELGRFTKADGTKSEPNEAAPKAEPKADSKFERAKKDAERLARNRREFEEEKARERAQIQAEREALARQRQSASAPADTFTSKQYEDAATDFRNTARAQMARGEVDEAAGNFDLATKASEAAQKVRQSELQTELEQKKGGFEQTWRSGMESTIKEIPDLGNPETPLAKTVMDLFKSNEEFGLLPDGFRKCAQIAQWKLGSEKASALENENTNLKAEIGRLQKLVSPLGGSPTERTGPMSFEQMAPEQQKAALRQWAEEQDSRAA